MPDLYIDALKIMKNNLIAYRIYLDDSCNMNFVAIE